MIPVGRRQHSKRRDPQRVKQTPEQFEMTTAVLLTVCDPDTGEELLVDLETGEYCRDRG